jgi:aspartyl-tRNA(Asn)/glutamyl-tRNA(Gln) amidotransferase subunit C
MDGLIMSDEITPELFEHLVDLAAFAFDPAEAKYLRRELNNQLRAIHQLEAVPLDAAIPPAAHGVPYTEQSKASLREDLWNPWENPDGILAQVPEVEDRYIIVPDIPHTALE